MFCEHYKTSAEITRLRNEHYIQHEGKKDEKSITDSMYSIGADKDVRIYHLECESKRYSEDILIRMFKYDIMSSKRETDEKSYKLTINMPRSALLALVKDGNPPEYMTYEIETADGSVSYKVPVIRMSDYTLDKIFERKMYYLIPFYFFNVRKEFVRYNSDEVGLKEFQKLYSEITDRVRDTDIHELSERSKGVIIN